MTIHILVVVIIAIHTPCWSGLLFPHTPLLPLVAVAIYHLVVVIDIYPSSCGKREGMVVMAIYHFPFL